MKRETVAGVASVKLLCATFGVSRQAYYAAKKAPAPASNVVRLPVRPDVAPAAKVLERIEIIIKENPAWGVRKVWATLRREHELKVSKKRVWALMKANGLVLARDSEPGEPTRGHVAVPEPNRRLAADFTTVWTKLDGVVAVVPTIDCGCRSVLGLEVTKDQQAPAVLASVEQSLREAFGEPSSVPIDLELRTDHGPQYTGADCADLVRRWGLTHTFAPVGRPTGNAVVERFIRTMKEEVIWLRDWNTAAELREAITAWLVKYHTRRAHQSLGWMTPSEYRTAHLSKPVAQAA
jgi:putative transposase